MSPFLQIQKERGIVRLPKKEFHALYVLEVVPGVFRNVRFT
jgi:hypothetical protein